MARIRLGRYEATEGELPRVCIRCGAPATAEARKRFSWHPPWVAVLILAGLLPYAIVAMILTKRMTVQAPFCAEHKNHWRWRMHAQIWSAVLLAVLFVAGLAVYANMGQGAGAQRGADTFFGFFCLGMVLGALGWVIFAMILQSTAIRPKEITDRSITLAGVAPHFIEEVEADRDREEERRDEEDAARRRRHTHKDADQFDDPDRPRRRRAPDDRFEEDRG